MKKVNMYPAVFTKEGDGYSVYFPHIEGAFTCGNTFEEALFMAKDCLELVLESVEQPPIITDITDLKLKENEQIILVEADMLAHRRRYYSQLIKKTLVIPMWLNDIAIKKDINFSQLLQKALKDELNIK